MQTSEEKLCLKWNDFQENAINAFETLKDDREFSDVTLACEDGPNIEAHKAILASSSSIFMNILRRNKHSHPLIYMRGLKSEDLVAMIDFLYTGEANVYQENINSFLALAEELQLKGLTGTNEIKESGIQELVNPISSGKPKLKSFPKKLLTSLDEDIKPTNPMHTVTFKKTLQNNDELDPAVSSMMQKKYQGCWSCNICGKTEKNAKHLENHIEAKHIEGVTHPCGQCGKYFRSRNSLSVHLSKYHREQTLE